MNRQLLALFNAGAVITSSLDLQFVLNTVTREMAGFMGVAGCAISELNSDDVLELLAEYGPEGWSEGTSEEGIYHIDDYPLTKKVLTDQIAVQLTSSQPGIEPSELAYMQETGLKTLVMLPMVYHDRVVGLMEIMDDRFEHHHSSDEIAIAQLLANQAASAVENARLYEKSQLQLREQIALREAGVILASSLDLNQVLTCLAEQVCEAVRATSAYISNFDPSTRMATVLAEYFSSHASQEERNSDLGESYLEEGVQALIDGLPAQYHVDDEHLGPMQRAHLQLYGAKSMLIIPIQLEGQTIASAEIWESRRKRSFTPDEIQLCQRIAQLGVIAIENARLYEQAQKEIAERKKATRALQESEARYELATKGANDGLWDWDLNTDIIYFSPRWASMLGFEESVIHKDPEFWFQLIHPDDIDRVKRDLEAHIDGLTQHFENEHQIRHKDGGFRWVLTRGIAVHSEDGSAIRIAGSQADITKRKRAEDQLVHDAFHDALTGLPNRVLFLDRLGRAIERAKRREESNFAVLFLDLDRFKRINDSLGHAIGDLLLVSIARRLEIYLRSVDTIARLGGDEFAVLLEELDHSQSASQVAERIHGELKLPFNLGDHQVFVTASIGIVYGSADYHRPGDMLRDADIAMYRAKAQGRARHEEFTQAMRSDVEERMALENGLRRAIGLGEFRIFYQPIISFDTNRVVGFEALVRWQHADRGLLKPAAFLSVAEESGLIIPIDWWVLQEACRALKIWQREYPSEPQLRVSVNISGKHFSHMDLYDQICNILKTSDLAPESLILEITENTIIENTVNATRLIERLRERGIEVQIDDFGTGYSSLSYLQKYPIDAIKIDRSFISRMSEGANHIEIVRAIVSLARELGMRVIAEGVETEVQKNHLKDLACRYGQGYLISEPIDGQSVDRLLAAGAGIKPRQEQAEA